jgi:DNA polymerase
MAIDAGDYDTLNMLWSPLEALSFGLRSLIAAPPGHDLIAADYSAIEARVLPWLAGDEKKLQLFRDGVDTYVKAAADVGSTDRQLGKICELALGYGMGALKFAATANGWGVPLGLKDAQKIAQAWRQKNKLVPVFWRDLEEAVKACVRKSGHRVRVGRLTVASSLMGGVVYIKLPSGRYLWYHSPEIRVETRAVDVLHSSGVIKSTKLEFESIYFAHAHAGRWSRTSTYGGKLVENVTQAVARDCLAEALLHLRDTPYKVVMHVHDSIVSEVASGTGDVGEFEQLILNMPQWANGLPLAAEGYRGPRFTG